MKRMRLEARQFQTKFVTVTNLRVCGTLNDRRGSGSRQLAELRGGIWQGVFLRFRFTDPIRFCLLHGSAEVAEFSMGVGMHVRKNAPGDRFQHPVCSTRSEIKSAAAPDRQRRQAPVGFGKGECEGVIEFALEGGAAEVKFDVTLGGSNGENEPCSYVREPFTLLKMRPDFDEALADEDGILDGAFRAGEKIGVQGVDFIGVLLDGDGTLRI